MTAASPIVEARGVVTRFGNKLVHDRIDLDVAKGEIFAIVGGSGSGKSTLMREIVMLHRPDAGSIKVFGHEVTHLGAFKSHALRRRIGVTFQYGALFNELTVLENVCVPFQEHTDLSPRLYKEVAAVKLVLAGLDPKDGALYPAQLSGGMRKRAALARAIALDPELVALDEPSSGLDPITADALDELILKLKDLLGLTILMVTHDMDSLWRIADTVALIGNGRILGTGSMKELSASDNPVVKPFFTGPRGRQKIY